MPLTVTPDAATATFGLHIDYIAAAGTQVTADIYRGLSATGPWEFLRTVDLLAQEAYAFDNTAPLDTPVWYRTVADDGTEFITGPNTIVTDGVTGWLKDPGRPWADIALTVCEAPDPLCDPADVLSWVGFDTFGRPTDAGLMEISNDEKPSDVWARRKNMSGTMRFFSRTLAMKTRVYELFTAGGPLFLQLPPVYGWADDFLQTTADLTEDYVAQDQRKPWRRWEAPFRTVRRPSGPIQGTSCANWCAVNDAFTTYADLTAAAGDWGDIADGSLVCP
jgi:hypothetical protein